jgi:peptide-methionine (S)-S-oxide reductase
MLFNRTKTELPTPESALPGRAERPFPLAERHRVLDAPLVTDEVPEGFEVAIFGLGCFWGAEEIFWQVPGVWSTSAGYAGGSTPNPSYEEVCTGRTGHTEAVRVVFDPAVVSYDELVAKFYEFHDPTQGMRQGNDLGTQYRSAIYTTSPEQERTAREVTERYQPELTKRGYDAITTEIRPAPEYYYAEDVHQQYLAKVPDGYRCHAATGVPVPRSA